MPSPRGPSRWRRARTGATITLGGAGSDGSGSPVSAWSTPRRSPIVSVSGLTLERERLPGRQQRDRAGDGAGHGAVAAASSGAIRQARSSAKRWASSPVAVTTRRGVRSLKAASAAATTACAASGTATVVSPAQHGGDSRLGTQQAGDGGQAAGRGLRRNGLNARHGYVGSE